MPFLGMADLKSEVAEIVVHLAKTIGSQKPRIPELAGQIREARLLAARVPNGLRIALDSQAENGELEKECCAAMESAKARGLTGDKALMGACHGVLTMWARRIETLLQGEALARELELARLETAHVLTSELLEKLAPALREQQRQDAQKETTDDIDRESGNG